MILLSCGYCRKKEEIRTFRLSRIKHLRVLPDLFERELPVDYSLTAAGSKPCPDPVLKLRFSPEIAHRLYDEFQEDQIRLYSDGSYYVTIPLSLNNWTFHYLLSFGKYVEILEPKEARTMLRERAADIVKLYQ